jgi:hypothetical protein
VLHDVFGMPFAQIAAMVDRRVVVSDTLTASWPGIRTIRRADAYQQIAELRRQAGKYT